MLGFSVLPLLAFGQGWRVPPDGAWYLLQGWNLVSGEGYTVMGVPQTVRGPVFPGLIGSLALLLGRDVETLAWATRLLALVNPVLVYLLIKRISGPVAGLVAAALVALFGSAALLDQAFNVDSAQLTVVLAAALLVLSVARRGNRGVLSFLSGGLLGAALLTKETAFAILPLGLVAALLLGWSLRGVILHYVGVAVTCAPWWLWVWSKTGEVYLVGRAPSVPVLPLAVVATLSVLLGALLYRSSFVTRFLGSERRRRWLAWAVVLVWTMTLSVFFVRGSTEDTNLRTIYRFVYNALDLFTPLWYLLPLAAVYLIWKAARGHRLWAFYAALLAFQVPVVLAVLVNQFFNARQWLILQVLLYGVLAALLVEVLKAVSRRRESYRALKAAAASVLLAALLLGTPSHLRAMAESSNNSNALVYDQYNYAVQKMDDWLSENVPGGETILSTWVYSHQLIFLDKEKHDWALLEVECERGGSSGQHVLRCVPSKEIAQDPPREAIWFEMDKECNAVTMTMPTLVRRMDEARAEYVLISRDPVFPGTMTWISALVDSGAFQVAHAEYLPSFTATGEAVDTPYSAGLVLLSTTGQPPAPVPTHMSPESFAQLITCGKQGELLWFSSQAPRERREALLSTFPNGIEITGDGPKVARTQERVDKIYDDRRQGA